MDTDTLEYLDDYEEDVSDYTHSESQSDFSDAETNESETDSISEISIYYKNRKKKTAINSGTSSDDDEQNNAVIDSETDDEDDNKNTSAIARRSQIDETKLSKRNSVVSSYGNDRDECNAELVDESIIGVKKKTKKFAIIDSDSDDNSNLASSYIQANHRSSNSLIIDESSEAVSYTSRLSNNHSNTGQKPVDNLSSQAFSSQKMGTDLQAGTSNGIPINLRNQIYDQAAHRISENFNIANALSSTIIGDTTPMKRFNHFDGIIKSEILTPRTKPTVPSPCSSPDIIISDDDSDDDSIIQVKPMKQPTLQEILQKVQAISRNQSNNSNASNNSNISEDGKLEVSHSVYMDQKKKVQDLNFEIQRTKNLLNMLNLDGLPDKGEQLLKKQANMKEAIKTEEQKLQNMVSKGTNISGSFGDSLKQQDLHTIQKDNGEQSTIINISSSSTTSNNNTSLKMPTQLKPATWEELNDVAAAVQPRTFGKQAMATLNAQKALTMDRLQHLHGSLKTCPAEDTYETDPEGLKVELMPHQKRALAWLLWRENQKPPGGILADDMGLGKTLTMISLVLKSIELENSDDEEDEQYNGGTLIVCPASVISQWDGEIRCRLKKGMLSMLLHHGTNRETKARKLCKPDVVLTTYSIVMHELGKETAIYKIKWDRIILDEAHLIRNYKAKTSIAVCSLKAKFRWTLTGTPIQNKEADLYALLKFLRVTPFDDYAVFRRWVSDKNTGGQERLNTVMSSLMLRRTKAQLMEKGSLTCLPDRHWEIIEIRLEKKEMDVYQKVLIFSKTLFAQFLHQRSEKNQDYANQFTTGGNGNEEYYKMHKKLVRMNGVKDVKQHEILVLLLRLRQICCHPSLIHAMLESGEIEAGENYEEDDPNVSALALLDQLNGLKLDDNEEDVASGLANEQVTLAEATRGILHANNEIFDVNRRSSKLTVVLEMVKTKVIPNGDKCIVVSQWTSLLKLLAIHFKTEYIKFEQLDGTVSIKNRGAMINNFNNPDSDVKVLLLSLTAGGVGLNLVGANHLFLLDLHWNPQLELQAQDRIYRVGQKKPVYVYKFMAMDTIEERIKKLQDNKRELADALLVGSRMKQTKLSLDDLKMLFNMN